MVGRTAHASPRYAREGRSLREGLCDFFREVRSQTEGLARPLTPEDAQIQSMEDVSPTKWHLAHTSWFFETFLLEKRSWYRRPDPRYRVLYNSYYNAVGEQHPRPRRGLVSRPSLDEVLAYRRIVDEAMIRLVETAPADELEGIAKLVDLGLHHEEQHQELLLTDILHVFWSNPLRPAYASGVPPTSPPAPRLEWHGYEEELCWIGDEGEGFAFDNERPRHRVFLHAFELASRPVTAGEYMEFVADGGYGKPALWLSDGWARVQAEGWEAPFYWERRGGTWYHMTLYGMRPVDAAAPVCHLSYYEADAYARWAGARLPTEAEWEVAATEVPVEGNLRESGALVPLGDAGGGGAPRQLYGDVWEWTQSAYGPYPGYRPEPGAVGEYNGKFMCNQLVLRGGSFATPAEHIRPSYRNFFPPDARWQFTGLRLARDPS